MKITEGYDLDSKPNSDTNLCESPDHVVTQTIIKIEIWSRKAKIDMMAVRHNGNLPQGTNNIWIEVERRHKAI